MRVFVLAGGFATRLWPLTEKRAKPLLPIAGKPLLSHLIEKIPPEMRVTVSTNAAFAEGFEAWEDTMHRPHLTLLIEASRKDEQKIGALGAVADWVEQEDVEDDVLLLTGDNYLGFSLEHFLAAYHPGVPLLAAYDIKDRKRAALFGTVLVDPKAPTHITGFEEKPKEPQTSLVSTGCSILPKDTLPVLLAFAAQHPDNVGGIFEEFLRRHIPVECFTFTEHWLDIGSFPSYLEAHRLLVSRDPIIHSSAVVEHTTCNGSVAIGAKSTVRESELTDCIIFEGCTIENCILRDCIIDDSCVLSGIDLDQQMLRRGTTLQR